MVGTERISLQFLVREVGVAVGLANRAVPPLACMAASSASAPTAWAGAQGWRSGTLGSASWSSPWSVGAAHGERSVGVSSRNPGMLVPGDSDEIMAMPFRGPYVEYLWVEGIIVYV